MHFNLNTLKNFTLLYVTKETHSEHIITLHSIFKNIFLCDTFEKGYATYQNNKNLIDMIVIDTSFADEQYLPLIESIREHNKVLPIILAVEHIDRNLLNLRLEHNISNFLLKPIKLQEFSKNAFFYITNYKRKQNMKNSVKLLGTQLSELKKTNEMLEVNHQFASATNKFYEHLHSNFFRLLKIKNDGTIVFVSPHAKHFFDEKAIQGRGIESIFIQSALIQKAMLTSFKNRTIETVHNIEFVANPNKSCNLIVAPYFNEELKIEGFEIFIDTDI